jgi:DNA-binding MarR family transcriptional regulator
MPEGHSDRELGRLLRQLTVETDRFVEVFGDAHGLHRTDLNALVVIMDGNRRGEPVSPTTLARALHLSASATTAVLDRLEAAGHVLRGPDPSDRRKVGLTMADTATALGEQFFRPLADELKESWGEFTDAQRETIARFLVLSIEATIRVRATLAR